VSAVLLPHVEAAAGAKRGVKQRVCSPSELPHGLPFGGLIFYGARQFTLCEFNKSNNIKGLADRAAFGGRLDAIHFDAG
jgi:hypothetical protein